ncbi:peptidyl-prolyl cis-trans isomerase SurA [Pustulibacterium marinum]|uniref:Peptidyl-prolyl cis-trans isomerase SurA n=2 Tax=Pustulibacterium marinum TaxID=1224947 RepID=A0A1I7FQZ8_9FLAO|nr:peptidyl-prolyl cis-trans isomerase SurA [Pustulibacterium marinum]
MMRRMNKNIFAGMMLTLSVFGANAQEDVVAMNTDEVVAEPKDTTVVRNYVKVDGVASVVGDYIILDSDIEKALISLKSQDVNTDNISSCNLLGKLMEDKLFMHQAIQDSIEVTDTEIRAMVDRRVDYFLESTGGDLSKVLEIYKMDSEGELREELTEILKEQELTNRMRTQITDKIEVTPEEVRQFFYSIPEEERPTFGKSVEISQIVVEPEIPAEETEKVVEKLRKMKEDIEDNGVRFSSKAMLYSQDPGSKTRGGLYVGITRKSQFVKEFKDIAFSLQEGEVSDPFKTEFGWHILTVDKVRGEQRDIRHILIKPEIPRSAVTKAKAEIDSIRQLILDDKISFEEAAKSFSDEKETKDEGGKLINPRTFDFRFELSKMDPTMYSNVSELKESEISQPIYEQDDRSGRIYYKIIKVSNLLDDHKADYSKDYTRIQELALQDKQLNEVKDWIQKKIKDTYISVSEDHEGCDFANDWVKEEDQ